MNVAERSIVPEQSAANLLPVAHRSSPPAAIKVLIPTWGLRYTRQFLEFCLPTLLAPGNLPALAQALPCTFVAMTSLRDEPLIREHPAWRRLAQICRVEVQLIDDLITDGNHTTTITLAYARAVREAGAQMLDTCFIFLVSDYLVADGALANVLARIQAGASGVLACNFQIVAEDAIPFLRRRTDPTRVEISLSSRELLSWALGHLHSATTANIVNFKLTHNEHANRLFWRVDENTLIGRPYLMHMIGIRPEVTDFIVGSSCDYSFIPELCPSNNVVVITDSDDYLVVEMQPRDHERNDVRLGPFDPKHLASTLAEWTTARHRENVQYNLVYHAADIPINTAEVAEEAEAFIDRVTRNLTSAPQPYRMHPYWIGAITAHRSATGQNLNSEDLNFLLGQASDQSGGIVALLWRIRIALFGTPPNVRPWHPLWPDYRMLLEALQKLFAENGRLIIVSNTPNVYARWLARSSPHSISMESSRLRNLSREQYMPLVGGFDACLLSLAEGDLKLGHEFLERSGPLLKQNGQIFVFTTNHRTDDFEGFGQSVAYHAAHFSNLKLWLSETKFVRASRLRWKLRQTIVRLARAVARRPLFYLPVAAIAGGFLALASYTCNRAALRTRSEPPRRSGCSSVFMVMRPSPSLLSIPLPRFADEDLALPRPPVLSNADEVLFQQFGGSQHAPPPTTKRRRTEDARRLAVILARYKFVANLLAGRHDVCELGRSHPLGIRLVLPQVRKIGVYDNDKIFIANIRRRNQGAPTLQADVHDIVREALPRSHDAIYSFDVLERTAPEHEDDFVRHLRDSLGRNCDVAIIGCPSPDHDDSATACIYTRTGRALRELMHLGFDMVMLFSMNEAVIQPGISPKAQYFLALCCAKKQP
jgi:hypothetical protein